MSEQFKKQFVAIGFGLNNAIVTLVSGINAPLIGLLLDRFQQGVSTSLDDYLFVFNVLKIIAILSIIISIFFIKETFCKTAAGLYFLKPKDSH